MATTATLVVVTGLPGSGKTTHARDIADHLDAVRLCPDDWMLRLDVDLWNADTRDRIERLQWDLGRDLLARGQSVVVEWGTWAQVERDQLRDDGRAAGARVELHHLHAPVEVLWQRIAVRDREDPPITRAHLDDWAGLFQWPDDAELATWDHGIRLDTDDAGRDTLQVRAATPADRPFLRAMLAEAAAWREGVDRPVAEVVAPTEVGHYLPPDWPREGEAGVVATVDGTRAGAAWWTHFTVDDPGYGFVAPDLPELTVGVVPALRGRGHGRALLTALCTEADRRGLGGLSLSVESDNSAVGLYEDTGFVLVADTGGALTMVRRTPAGPDTSPGRT